MSGRLQARHSKTLSTSTSVNHSSLRGCPIPHIGTDQTALSDRGYRNGVISHRGPERPPSLAWHGSSDLLAHTPRDREARRHQTAMSLPCSTLRVDGHTRRRDTSGTTRDRETSCPRGPYGRDSTNRTPTTTVGTIGSGTSSRVTYTVVKV